MIFKQDQLQDFNYAGSLEWLETNGLGGYASSTVSGANSRRYHGLLVAAMHPPVGRTVILSKLEETLLVDEKRFELSANQYPGAVHPLGFRYLKSFERNFFPDFVFEAGGVKIKKTIVAIQGENTTLIIYEVLDASKNFRLELLPLCASRDYHSISHWHDLYFWCRAPYRSRNYICIYWRCTVFVCQGWNNICREKNQAGARDTLNETGCSHFS